MRTSRGHRRPGIDIWPGFVDALTQLVMIIVFVLMLFTAGQFYLTNAISGRDNQLAQLAGRINQLTELLALETKGNDQLKLQLGTLQSKLDALNADLASKNAALAKQNADMAKQNGAAALLQQQLLSEQAKRKQAEEDIAQRDQKISAAQTTIDQLNQQLLALRQQLQQIADQLDASEKKNKDQEVQIADLGSRLNAALATKVAELAKYRSEFFGRLRELLGDRADIRIVGDRFLFQSEVLFSPGSADLGPDARAQLTLLANALKEIAAKIPTDIDWVLQVEGHTDRTPISTAQFPSNWELSSARATSVVKFLASQGIPANRLATAGYGEFQPVDPGDTQDAFRRNRRIELKLTAH